MVHFGLVVESLGVAVETVADVADEAGFEDEGLGEWTAEMGRMDMLVVVGGRDWIGKDLVGRSELELQRAIFSGWWMGGREVPEEVRSVLGVL